jgi:hypothetical protein
VHDLHSLVLQKRNLLATVECERRQKKHWEIRERERERKKREREKLRDWATLQGFISASTHIVSNPAISCQTNEQYDYWIYDTKVSIKFMLSQDCVQTALCIISIQNCHRDVPRRVFVKHCQYKMNGMQRVSWNIPKSIEL